MRRGAARRFNRSAGLAMTGSPRVVAATDNETKTMLFVPFASFVTASFLSVAVFAIRVIFVKLNRLATRGIDR